MYAACFPFSLGLPKGFCAVIASLLLEIMLKKIAYCAGEGSPEKDTVPSVSEGSPEKDTVPSVSRMLAVKSTSAAVPIGRCWSVPSGWCQCLPQQISVLFIYTVHTPSVPFHTPSKLTDFDGILCFLYSPKKIIS